MKALWYDRDIAKALALQVGKIFSRNAAFAPFSPFHYGDIEEPAIPNPRWLKVRNRRCGLCASDIHLIFIHISPRAFPAAVPGGSRTYLGHELVGEVMEVGAEVVGLAPGDRVAQRIEYSSCNQMEISPPCRQCAAGSYTLCENMGARPLASEHPGAGFSPFMVMHRSQPFRIPAEVTDDAAVLLEPAACSVHAVLKRTPKAGDRVLVVGSGTLGLLTLAAARALQPDARVFVSALYPFQAEQAERMKAHGVFLGKEATYRGIKEICGARLVSAPFGNRIVMGGFDMVYDTVGSDASVGDSLRWVRARGSVVLIGVNLKPGAFDYTPVWYQEVDLTGVYAHGTEASGETTFEITARLLAEKRIRVDGMITHRFPLREYRAAIRTFLSKGKSKAIKIVLEHTES
jgi:threonine dehydrogenase-like Zn-dependent dehydrogenase